MPSHLNVFEPYERKGAHYEDALTRAFLLVLRGVPVAHAAWLHLVDVAHRKNGGQGIPQLHELVTPNISMQTASVPEEAARVVSVVQTDEDVAVPDDAAGSPRRQVLDGVAAYGELAIVIENKPWHGHIWRGQLDINVPEGTEHDPQVACVTWKAIVSAWGRLLDSDHLSPAEDLLVGDFLDYVEQHFPALRPYSRVGLCGRDVGRLLRRCKAVLTRIAGPDAVGYHRGWGWYIDLDEDQCARKLGLFPLVDTKTPSIVLEIDPGDTMGQAQTLYETVQISDVAGLLEQPNWVGWSNFHLMFMTSGFFRPAHLTDVKEYWMRWVTHSNLIRRWKLEEFSAAFDALLELGIVGPEHRAEFDRHTAQTKRGNICFAPGVTLQWHLPLDEAVRLDDRDRLEDAIRGAIEQGTKALRLRWPRSSGG